MVAKKKDILLVESHLSFDRLVREILHQLDLSLNITSIHRFSQFVWYLGKCPRDNIPTKIILIHRPAQTNAILYLRALRHDEVFSTVPAFVIADTVSEEPFEGEGAAAVFQLPGLPSDLKVILRRIVRDD